MSENRAQRVREVVDNLNSRLSDLDGHVLVYVSDKAIRIPVSVRLPSDNVYHNAVYLERATTSASVAITTGKHKDDSFAEKQAFCTEQLNGGYKLEISNADLGVNVKAEAVARVALVTCQASNAPTTVGLRFADYKKSPDKYPLVAQIIAKISAPGVADKYEPLVRSEVMAMLSEPKAKQSRPGTSGTPTVDESEVAGVEI